MKKDDKEILDTIVGLLSCVLMLALLCWFACNSCRHNVIYENTPCTGIILK